MFNFMRALFYLYDTRDRESILLLPTFLNVHVEGIPGERFVVEDMCVWTRTADTNF